MRKRKRHRDTSHMDWPGEWAQLARKRAGFSSSLIQACLSLWALLSPSIKWNNNTYIWSSYKERHENSLVQNGGSENGSYCNSNRQGNWGSVRLKYLVKFTELVRQQGLEVRSSRSFLCIGLPLTRGRGLPPCGQELDWFGYQHLLVLDLRERFPRIWMSVGTASRDTLGV